MCHKGKGNGCCIQCDFKNCSLSYHVRCAVRRGLIEEWSKIEEKAGDVEENFVPIFCEDHAEKGFRMFKEKGRQGIISMNQTPEYKQKLVERLKLIQSKKNLGGKVPKKKQSSGIQKRGKTLKIKKGINMHNKNAAKDINDVI